jgi:hypothetical protein
MPASRRLPALLVLLTLIGPGAAQETSPERIGALIAQLEEADFARREAATAALVGLGEGVREALRAARAGLPLEARLRVDAILARIDRAPVSGRHGRLVSLHLSQLPLSEALAAFEATTDVALELDERYWAQRGGPEAIARLRLLPVTLDAQDLPLLQVLDILCNQHDLGYMPASGRNAFTLMPGNSVAAPVVYSGPLRVSLASIVITRQTFFNGAPSVVARLLVQVDVEPGADVLGILGPVSLVQARDDTGADLAQDADVTRPFLSPLAGRGRAQFHAPFTTPEPEASELLLVEVAFDLLVPGPGLWDELARPGPATVGEPGAGPLELRLDAWAASAAGTRIEISFREGAPGGDLPPGVAIPDRETIEVSGPGGTSIELPGPQRSRRDGREVRILELPPGPVEAIRVTALAAVARQPIRVRFENVPLP